jgi:hypothetical protein
MARTSGIFSGGGFGRGAVPEKGDRSVSRATLQDGPVGDQWGQ